MRIRLADRSVLGLFLCNIRQTRLNQKLKSTLKKKTDLNQIRNKLGIKTLMSNDEGVAIGFTDVGQEGDETSGQ